MASPPFLSLVTQHRSAEIQRIKAAIESSPQPYALIGPQGIGKSFVASCVARLLKNEGWKVLAYSARKPDAAALGKGTQPWNSFLGPLTPEREDFQRVQRPGRRRLILLDAIDEWILDDTCLDRMAGFIRAAASDLRLLITARPCLRYVERRLAVMLKTMEVGALSISDFSEALNERAISGDAEQIARLYHQVRGLPLAAGVVREFGDSLAKVDYSAVVSRIEEIGIESFEGRLLRVPAPGRDWSLHALKVLTALREPIPLNDLFRLTQLFEFEPKPQTARQLWEALCTTQLLDLCCVSAVGDPRGLRLELRHPVLKRMLTGKFGDGWLTDTHRMLARGMDVGEAFDRRNVIFHALEGFRHDPEGLAAWMRGVRWTWSVFLSFSVNEDWTETGNHLLLDLTRLVPALPASAREEPAEYLPSDFDIRDLGDTDQLRLAELRRAIQRGPRIAAKRAKLCLAVDLWPGYLPFFAVERELAANGIELAVAQGSSMKVQLLLEGHYDLIATTIGGMTGQPRDRLRRYEILGVLNRSRGADQILASGKSIRLSDGKIDLHQLTAAPGTALVMGSGTALLFLLWFFRMRQLNPATFTIELVPEYDDLPKRITDDVCLISAWEPYASRLRRDHPSFSAVFDSGMPEGVVYDLLIADRRRADAIVESDRLGVLWKLYDSAVRERLWNDPSVRLRLQTRYPILGSTLKFIDRVEHYGIEQRKQFFSGAGSDSLGAVLDRVIEAWRPLGICPSFDRDFSAWATELRELKGTRPFWILERDSEVAEPAGSDGMVFISYAHGDRGFVERLSRRLEWAGVTVWYDPELRGGDEFEEILERQVKESLAVIVVVSPNSNKSAYVRKEIAWAKGAGKRIVPIWLQGELPTDLTELTAVSDGSDLVAKLAKAIFMN